jgi:hypothetical protein
MSKKDTVFKKMKKKWQKILLEQKTPKAKNHENHVFYKNIKNDGSTKFLRHVFLILDDAKACLPHS